MFLFTVCVVISIHISLHLFNASREMDLLCIPSNTGSLRLVQWPLFLLSSKVDVTWNIIGDRLFWYTVIPCLLNHIVFSRSCWLWIWPWTAKIDRQIFGIEYVGTNTWHMQFRSATTVLKKFYIPWLTVKGDFGMNPYAPLLLL
jgi:hypothetical protein